MILVDESQSFLAAFGDGCRERDHHRFARGYLQVAPQREDWIENGPHRSREMRGRYRLRIQGRSSPPQKVLPTGLTFDINVHGRRCGQHMHGPGCFLSGIARPAASEKCRFLRNELGLQKQLLKCRMRQICRGSRQNNFRVTGQLHPFRLAAVVGDSKLSNFRIILRRDRHFEQRFQITLPAMEIDFIDGKDRFVAIGGDARRLVCRRPHLIAIKLAQIDILSPRIERGIRSPASDFQRPRATKPSAGAGQHHAVFAVGKQVGARIGVANAG